MAITEQYKTVPDVMAELSVSRAWVRYWVDTVKVVEPLKIRRTQLFTPKQVKILREHKEGKR